MRLESLSASMDALLTNFAFAHRLAQVVRELGLPLRVTKPKVSLQIGALCTMARMRSQVQARADCHPE